ncbi:MAG: DNA repair protein RecO [Candidatus Nomurabacteria bacterium]|nr:MAG: DNA repair protein RecO [Candidatus Nomurabacteria bacterium]
MKTSRTRAIVLRRTNYGEADRVLDLLTPDGRLSVMARGVRKEKSKLAGGIELFAVCDVVVGEGKGNLSLLTSARLVQFYRHILEDYDRMQFAYEVLAQVARASASLDESEWYDIVAEVLAALDVLTVPIALTQTWFYIRVAALLGDELNTLRDCQGSKLESDKTYRYDSQENGFIIDEKGSIGAGHIKVLRLAAAKPLSIILQVGGMNEYLVDCVYVARQHAALQQVLK